MLARGAESAIAYGDSLASAFEAEPMTPLICHR